MYSIFIFILLFCHKAECVVIEGWIFADNWFEFYFNGEKIVTDPILFQPKNAVKIRFDAPSSGLYSFVVYAKDYADEVTGLEYDDTCLGDGGIRISLSDGTISNANWRCFVEMEGPINTEECGLSNDDDCTNSGTLCKVQYNTVPSCWNEAVCETTKDEWQIATLYADELVGFGKLKDGQTMDCGEDVECSLAKEIDWNQYGASSFIWTSNLVYDNSIICRYEYFIEDAAYENSDSDINFSATNSQLTNTQMDNDSNIWFIIAIVFIALCAITSAVTIWFGCHIVTSKFCE